MKKKGRMRDLLKTCKATLPTCMFAWLCPDCASPVPAQHLPALRLHPLSTDAANLQVTEAGQSMFDQSANRFHLEVDYIKALPGGTETNFVLVSCAGMARPGV